MTLYRIPKKDIPEEEYIALDTFAFETSVHLYFTDRSTAVKFGGDLVEIYPVKS